MLYDDNDWTDEGGHGTHYNYCWMENITYGGVYAVQYIVTWDQGQWVYTMQAVCGPYRDGTAFTKATIQRLISTQWDDGDTFTDEGIWQEESDWTAI